MPVVWQIAGKMKKGQFEPLRDEFNRLATRFEGAEGFERAQLFVNHKQLQVQFLTFWSEFEASARFFRAAGPDFWQPLARHTEETGTVVCSAIECDKTAQETAAAS